ncbi:filamentous hemagglutinin N-terminal domain-containing protein [Ruegeria sp. 2012CJ41-6]|uniref:Filamentous hemagglutinin N-terminal domain-containing protein n=1 Tax=Ruegeria spongiae TaxID=2942209 RepID=A0ABT0PYR8_9RHOB|nr:filamentous hemagglutinin N-terminal domain-containing protein [Ruegeria spongiae]MCL6282723.1 filamentous hemagglutinin N-terminal domain-containing protein [Ruegeria spongiae]
MTMARKVTASVSLQAAGSKRLAVRLWLSVAPAALLIAAAPLGAQELPTGGTVAAGNAMIATPAPGQMTINQGSNAAVVNWNTFSVGQGGRVDITQPSAQSTILNRVTGNATSAIHGQINANGRVFVVNPNGIFIGPRGQINTSGFVASTLAIRDDDFMAGRYRFEGNGASAGVENAGLIQSVPGGYAALIGGKVKNSGVIRVPLGKVGLGAGEQVTLDFTGDGFLQVAVPSNGDDTMDALVENSGVIEANGGQVQLLAASARDAARQVVNMSGVIEARSVSGRNGAVVLGGSGGGVRVSGRIDTSADVVLVETSPRPVARPVQGGDITITGEAIALAGATLDASGAGAGDGGLIRVGGDFEGKGNLQRAVTTFVDAATRINADGGASGSGGRIAVWSDIFTEFNGTISARGGDLAGDGGFVEVSGKDDMRYRGLTDTRAPNGATGMLLLDPGNITVGSDPGDTFDAATIEANLDSTGFTLDTSVDGSGEPGDITINESISWSSGTLFQLIADNDIALNAAITGNTGTLSLDAAGTITTSADGAIDVDTFLLEAGDWVQNSATLPGFDVTDFQLNSTDGSFLRALDGDGSEADPYVLTDVFGLQGMDSDSLHASHFRLNNEIDATGTENWGFGEGGFVPIFSFDGSLDGAGHGIDGLMIIDASQGGLFENLNETARVFDLGVTNASINGFEGGVLATSNDGAIENVIVTGTVDSFDGLAGGMVAFNSGTITDSTADVSVSGSVGEGSEGDGAIGGLAGVNSGTITRSHATGDVQGVDFGSGLAVNAGGLVGVNSGTIQSSYATGDVSAAQQFSGGGTGNGGGLVGLNQSLVERSYSTGTVSVTDFTTNNPGGLIGLTSGGTVTASFWDTDLSGQSASDGGTGLTTAEFQDTQSFFDLTSPLGWDYVNDWAPGTQGQHPLNLTTSAVVFVQPDPLSVQYGQTDSATGTGPISGGTGTYVFGPDGDSLDTSGALSNLDFGQVSVGETTYVLTNTSLTSDLGLSYQVISLTGDATITPAPLTVVADDQSRTYGDEFSLGTTDFSLTSDLFFEDTIDSVALSSTGVAQFAPVVDSPYMITPSDAQGTGLSNYVITYETGNLTVNPAPLTVTADDLTRVYGDGFSFEGTEFTVQGLLTESDMVDSVTLTSTGADRFAQVSTGYDIIGSNATGSGAGNYDITYETGSLDVTPASLTVTATDQFKLEGQNFTFSGTEFVSSGLLNPADSVDSAVLFSDGASADATEDGSPYIIDISGVSGTGLENYILTLNTGEFFILPPGSTVDPPPIPVIEVTPPGRTSFEGTLETETGGGDSGSGSGGGTAVNPVVTAEGTLETVQGASTEFEAQASGCVSEDVSTYLACVADAMDDYAQDLDAIAQGLPPGLESIGDIINGASAGVRAAGDKAQARLALATTEAERQQIRSEAIQEARVAIRSAQTEIRKAITLIRAEDPELVSLQREQVETIVAAVGSAEIGLSRVLEL